MRTCMCPHAPRQRWSSLTSRLPLLRQLRSSVIAPIDRLSQTKQATQTTVEVAGKTTIQDRSTKIARRSGAGTSRGALERQARCVSNELSADVVPDDGVIHFVGSTPNPYHSASVRESTADLSRSRMRSILPVEVLGRSCQNSTTSGTMYDRRVGERAFVRAAGTTIQRCLWIVVASIQPRLLLTS